MSCTAAEIKVIRKEGPMVIFDLSDGSCVKYDLQNHVTIGKQGKEVKGLNSQLCGAMLLPCKDKFEDQGFFEYLKTLMYIGGRDAYTIAAVLKRVVDNQSKEGFVRLGINTYGQFRTPVSRMPKDMLKWLTADDLAYKSTLRQDHIDSWMMNREIYQSMLSQRSTLYKESFDKLIWLMLESTRYHSPASSTYSSMYFQLIDEYRCEPTALARYLVMVETREGVYLGDAARLLRDYHKMQKEMTKGYPCSYDKYPFHLMYAHHLVLRNYTRLCVSKFDDAAFEKTFNHNLEVSMGGYDFICPRHVIQIKDEAAQQQHCVASYIDNVIKGDCHIVLMRKHNNPNTAVLTLEVINGKVTHAAGKYNREPTDEEWKVIWDYEQCIPEDYKACFIVKEEEKRAV